MDKTMETIKLKDLPPSKALDEFNAVLTNTLFKECLIDMKGILAGGAIRSLLAAREDDSICDYDVYRMSKDPLTKEYFDSVRSTLKIKEVAIAHVVNAEIEGVPKPIQIMWGNLSANTPIELLQTFDFTVCMCYWDPNTPDVIYTTGKCYSDIVQKMLKINIITFKNTSLFRTLKYQEKGYKISKKDFDYIFKHHKVKKDYQGLVHSVTGNTYTVKPLTPGSNTPIRSIPIWPPPTFTPYPEKKSNEKAATDLFISAFRRGK